MNKATKIIFLFFIGISLIICLTGIYSLYVNLHKNEACTEKVEAVCYDMDVMHHQDGHRRYKTYTPCFKYE